MLKATSALVGLCLIKAHSCLFQMDLIHQSPSPSLCLIMAHSCLFQMDLIHRRLSPSQANATKALNSMRIENPRPLDNSNSPRRAQPLAELSLSERSEDSAVNRALRARIRRKLEAVKQEATQLPRLNCLGRRESVLSTYGIIKCIK